MTHGTRFELGPSTIHIAQSGELVAVSTPFTINNENYKHDMVLPSEGEPQLACVSDEHGPIAGPTLADGLLSNGTALALDGLTEAVLERLPSRSSPNAVTDEG